MKYVISENSIIVTIKGEVEIYGKGTNEYKYLKDYFNALEDKDNINEREVRKNIYHDKLIAVKKMLLKSVKISDELREKLNDTER